MLCFRELKHFCSWVFFLASGSLFAEMPQVPQCFKVHALVKMDEEHYWANWTNACPYIIDSVYVMVKFADKARNELANGVWGLHFVGTGEHRITRFTAPRTFPEFESVRIDKITTDSAEALHAPSEAPRPQLAVRIEPPPVAIVSALPPAPASVADHHKRGRELIEKRKYHEAIEELTEAIHDHPKFPQAYNARGYAYYMSRDYKLAVADLDEAIRLNPKYGNAYQIRSRARKAAGDLNGSQADSKQARALNLR
jgi:hypothetical protein